MWDSYGNVWIKMELHTVLSRTSYITKQQQQQNQECRFVVKVLKCQYPLDSNFTTDVPFLLVAKWCVLCYCLSHSCMLPI